MIISNIEINKNKFEEFVRVLLLEKYEILDGNSGKNVFFEVIENFTKYLNKFKKRILGKEKLC